MKTVEVSSFTYRFYTLLIINAKFQDEIYLPFSPADSPSGADSLLRNLPIEL